MSPQLYVFLQYLHSTRFSTSPLVFCLFIIVKCFHTIDVRLLGLGFLPMGLGWGRLEGGTDSTHGSLALKAYQQNLYLEYYY